MTSNDDIYIPSETDYRLLEALAGNKYSAEQLASKARVSKWYAYKRINLLKKHGYIGHTQESGVGNSHILFVKNMPDNIAQLVQDFEIKVAVDNEERNFVHALAYLHRQNQTSDLALRETTSQVYSIVSQLWWRSYRRQMGEELIAPNTFECRQFLLAIKAKLLRLLRIVNAMLDSKIWTDNPTVWQRIHDDESYLTVADKRHDKVFELYKDGKMS